MKRELEALNLFFAGLLKTRLSERDILSFSASLSSILEARFAGHWFSDEPLKGNAYRCIRSCHGRMDPVLVQVAEATGLDLQAVLPATLTVWIDPNDVSVRIGDEGSVWSVDLHKENTSPAAVQLQAAAGSPKSSESTTTIVPGTQGVRLTEITNNMSMTPSPHILSV